MDTRSRRVDEVQEASEESFPASDPPSYTPTIGSQADVKAEAECYEAAFERATCRIAIADGSSVADMPTFTARMSTVDPGTGDLHPIVLVTGQRVELHARTASQALSSAIAFLAHCFGSPTVYGYRCHDEGQPPVEAEPFVVDETA